MAGFAIHRPWCDHTDGGKSEGPRSRIVSSVNPRPVKMSQGVGGARKWRHGHDMHWFSASLEALCHGVPQKDLPGLGYGTLRSGAPLARGLAHGIFLGEGSRDGGMLARLDSERGVLPLAARGASGSLEDLLQNLVGLTVVARPQGPLNRQAGLPSLASISSRVHSPGTMSP